jgi:hypothetical protein
MPWPKCFTQCKDCCINFQDGKALLQNEMFFPQLGGGIVLINDPPNILANKFVLGLYE